MGLDRKEHVPWTDMVSLQSQHWGSFYHYDHPTLKIIFLGGLCHEKGQWSCHGSPMPYQLILLSTPPSFLLLGWVWLTNVFSQALLAREKPFLFLLFSYVSPGTKSGVSVSTYFPRLACPLKLSPLCVPGSLFSFLSPHPDCLLCAVSTTLPHFFFFLFGMGVHSERNGRNK